MEDVLGDDPVRVAVSTEVDELQRAGVADDITVVADRHGDLGVGV
jgi:hypothetical protein